MKTLLCNSCHHEWMATCRDPGDAVCDWCLDGIGHPVPNIPIPSTEWGVGETTERLTLVRVLIEPPRGQRAVIVTGFLKLPCGLDGKMRVSIDDLDRLGGRKFPPHTSYMAY